MPRKYVGALKIVCVGLALLIAVRARESGGDSPVESSMALLDGAGTESPTAAGESVPSTRGPRTDVGAEAGDRDSLPPAYAVIFSNGIFGKLPDRENLEHPLPTLVGLVDGKARRYAVFRTGEAKSLRIAEGEELNGVKILRIGTNRVLIEHRGRKVELRLFSGLGSTPLLTQEEGK